MTRAAALFAVYRRVRSEPFAWGRSDCLTFCGDCALAITGKDPIARFRGSYKTPAGARRALKRMGCADMAAAGRVFYREIAVAEAVTGDWARIENADGSDALGVVVGAYVWARAKSGILGLPLTEATHAFRVE